MGYCSTMSTDPIAPTDHANHMRRCISLAQAAPLSPTNYRVGCLLFSPQTNTVLSTGYTSKLKVNTHAEENARTKLAIEHNIPNEKVGDILLRDAMLYTTLELCVRRLSGNKSCVERILTTLDEEGEGGIRRVYVGLREADRSVKENDGLEGWSVRYSRDSKGRSGEWPWRAMKRNNMDHFRYRVAYLLKSSGCPMSIGHR